MFNRHVPLGLTLLLLSACSHNIPKTSQATPLEKQTPTTIQTADNTNNALPTESFNEWLADFKHEAINKGISEATFNQAFQGITPDPDIVKSDRSQPEFTKPVWEYLEGAVSPLRIKLGKQKLTENQAILEQISHDYAVDPHVIVAIWGMESGYGRFMGNKKVIRSLATLAYEGRRAQFAKQQLLAALAIIENGDISANDMLGSWAGAMGQTQFIPTTYLQWAVDYDKDGRRDIWTSTPDALASTAHYLAASKWQYNQPWGHEIKLPARFDYTQTDTNYRKAVSAWASQGITLMNGQPLPTSEMNLTAAILLPAGANGPAFIVYQNFFAIMKYNNSTSYALAVNLLADSFKGNGHIISSWPTQDRPLSRTERIDLQTKLNEKGYEAGHPDGIIGANTRRAIQRYQQSIGLPADGYPTHLLLQKLTH